MDESCGECCIDVKGSKVMRDKGRTIKGVGTIEATGKQTSEGFVVLRGTHISPNDDNTLEYQFQPKRCEI